MSQHVRVNPITCEAHGMCAELLPERITLDEWGYPIVDGTPLEGSQVGHARARGSGLPHVRAADRARRTAAAPAARGTRLLRRQTGVEVRGGEARPLSVGGEELADLVLLGARPRVAAASSRPTSFNSPTSPAGTWSWRP